MNIKIEDLNKSYGRKQALSGVSLTIEQGMFGLLGRNGAGKTTLMKVLASLLAPNSGKVTVCDVPLSHASEIRKMTGYLPQEFSMYPNMTVYEAMDYLGVLSGIEKSERKKRIPILLKKVNLEQKTKTKVKSLSGGMKRRLGIAQAILHDPKVLIVDEPTAGLDPEERVRFRNLLCEIAQERIVILSTHIIGDIEATCENIAILDTGKLIYNGTVTALVEQVEGKVYSLEVEKKDLAALKTKYLITGTLALGNHVNVRLISEEKPSSKAEASKASVEDAYMYLMHHFAGYNLETLESTCSFGRERGED